MESYKKREPTSAYESPTFGQEYSFEFKEAVGAMSISPCGRDVVLASRQGLHVIDLDDPYRQPRHLQHYTPWEVADVQWSPFASRDYWVVSTSNQKALVWNLMMSDAQSAVEHYLHAHTRAITDINFSAYNPDVLATCAVDSFIHCWDLRHPARPALSFADWFAGATQVKWNRQDPHIIASSHDKILRIWDARNGAHPLHSIEAHDTKIYGLDWNRVRTSAIVTCSLDKTIKFWDYSKNTKNPERVIHTSFPIWRARHTPFGHGILAMPQRDDNDLYLYNRQTDSPEPDRAAPVKSFAGHEGPVKEFLWRCRGAINDEHIDYREFQLVSWGADHKLRLHPMDEASLGEVGYIRGTKVHQNLHLTRTNATYKTFREGPQKVDLEKVKSSTSLHERLQLSKSTKTYKSGMTLRGRSTGMMHGFLSSRTNIRMKHSSKKDLDPMSWMKGVKPGRKEAALDQSISNSGIASQRSHRGSEEFETLADEISHVSEKFSKIIFKEDYALNQGFESYVKFSLRGMWDRKETPTFLECKIDFPEDYPMGSTPHLTISRTILLEQDFLEKLEKDAQAIADAYLKHKRNSLEAIVRYLHGGEKLEDVINWVTQDMDSSIVDIRPVEDSSSDDDDMGDMNDDRDAEFGLADSGLFEQANVNAHMPLAKACAGIWAQNGTLVCFFPPKLVAPASTTAFKFPKHGALLKASKRGMFGGRDKNDTSQHSKVNKLRSISSGNSSDSISDSESSDSEDTSSASSTSSRDASRKGITTLADYPFDRDHFGLSTQGTDRLFDGTLKSGETGSAIHSKAARPKSILKLHDLRDLLPPKEDLAKEYALRGQGACLHNSLVASAHGYNELAEVWTVLDLILLGKISGAKIPESLNTKQTAFARLQHVTSAMARTKVETAQPLDFVSWSTHPFGRQLLIEQLFDYYARIADVQMLATMSCILSTRDQPVNSAIPFQEPIRQKFKFSPAIRKLHDQEYFPSMKASTSISPDDGTSRIKTSSLRSPVKSRHDLNSLSSSLGTVVNDSGSLESSLLDGPNNRSFEGRSSTPKLSSSPEWIMRPLHKSSSTFANAIMTSIPRPFSLTTSAASSPPTMSFIKKKVSPIGSLTAIGGWTSGNTSGTALEFSRSSSAKNSERRVRISRRSSGARPVKGMTVTLKNEDKFEQSDDADQSLLSPEYMHLYGLWRADYAELLHSWSLLVTRAELLKFNAPLPNEQPEAAHRSSSLTIGANDTNDRAWREKKEVVASSHCPSCDMVSKSKSSTSACMVCNKNQPALCVLCNLPIYGRSSPCFVCGHILHVSCRKSWQGLSASSACPTGCGCVCSSPILPPEGIVTLFTDNIPQPLSPRSSRFTTAYLTHPHSRHSSPPASTATVRGFNMSTQPEHPHSISIDVPHTTPTGTGSRTPHHDLSNHSNHQIAYASLQSLAAQSRPRGDTAGAGGNSVKAPTVESETSASKNMGSRIRQSKSLMFAAGLGGLGAGLAGGASGENKKGKTSRFGSGSSTPATTAAGGGAAARKKGTRHSSLGKNELSAVKKDDGSQSQQKDDWGFFELPFDDEDDSDVEVTAF